MSRRGLLLVVALASVGCLGGYDDPGTGGGPGGPGASAKQLFDSKVRGVMATRCSSCHQTNASPVDPDFLGSGPTNYYQTLATYTSPTACIDGPCLVTFPDVSILVTKGVHSGGAVGWWTTDELADAKAWLAAEMDERGLEPIDPCADEPTMAGCGTPGGPGRPRTVEQAIGRFAACMDYDLWVTGPGNEDNDLRYTYSIAWANTEDGFCNGCHSIASDEGFCPGGACLMEEAWGTFDSHRKSPSVLKLVVPVAGTDGQVDLIQANRYIQKGYEGGGGGGHPSFELRAECSLALRSYVQATLDRYHDYTSTCTPAEMPPPI